MKDKSFLSLSTKLILYAGNIIIIVPLYIYLLWIYASITNENFFDAVSMFENILPDFVNGPDAAIKLSMICGLLSLTAGIISLRMRLSPWRLNMLLVVVNCILLSLNIFQLMESETLFNQRMLILCSTMSISDSGFEISYCAP